MSLSAVGVGSCITMASSTLLGDNNTFSGNTTLSTTTGYFQDNGGQVYNIAAYGAKCNDTTDDTNALQAAINAASSTGNGGTLFIPAGECLIDGAINIPYQATHAFPSTLPYQIPLRITGVSTSWNGYWTSISLPPNGSRLDMRFAGDATHNAKIDTRGSGVLQIDDVVLEDKGSDTEPFIFTSNTTLLMNDFAISGTGNALDTIILGATSTGQPIQSASSTAGFQGYGTKIENGFFENVQRAITYGDDANNTVVEDLTVSKTSGSNYSASDSAPFYFYHGAGNIIRGGTIELTNYAYGATLVSSVTGTQFDGIGWYDDNGLTQAQVHTEDTNSSNNMLIQGWGDLVAFDGPSAAKQTVIDDRQSTGTTTQQTTFARGLVVGTASGQGLQTSQINGITSILSADYSVPNGTNMTINTGSGGSYLNLQAYSTRFYTQGGVLEDEIQSGSASGGAYFLGNVGAGTTTPGTVLSLAGTTGILASTTATSTFLGGGINLVTSAGNTGCFAINGTCIVAGGGGSGTVGAGTQGQFPFYNSAGTTLTATSSLFLATNGNIGVATTTPWGLFSIAGASGGTVPVFAVSTSSLAGATSTVFEIDQNGNITEGNKGANVSINGASAGVLSVSGSGGLTILANGDVGINNTAPGKNFEDSGNAYFHSTIFFSPATLLENANSSSDSFQFLGTSVPTYGFAFSQFGLIGTTTTNNCAGDILCVTATSTNSSAQNLFNIASSSGASLFSVNNLGNVGIASTEVDPGFRTSR